MKRIEAKGIADTAHRTRAVCGRVFRYAIATGRATRDISPTAANKIKLTVPAWVATPTADPGDPSPSALGSAPWHIGDEIDRQIETALGR